jgi:hypothetical protein
MDRTLCQNIGIPPSCAFFKKGGRSALGREPGPPESEKSCWRDSFCCSARGWRAGLFSSAYHPG